MVPYKSAAQRRFMHARHTQVAKKWDKEAIKRRVSRTKTPPVNVDEEGSLSRSSFSDTDYKRRLTRPDRYSYGRY